jgi:hypothetical protein
LEERVEGVGGGLFLALESCRTSMEGRWQPMTLSRPDNPLEMRMDLMVVLELNQYTQHSKED